MSSSSPQDLLSFARSQYREFEHVLSFEFLRSGVENNVFSVQTAAGKYVVREYRSSTEPMVKAEARVLDLLQGLSGPLRTPEIVRTRSGAPISVFGRRPVTVYGHIPGQHFEAGEVSAESLGVLLSGLTALHQKTASLADDTDMSCRLMQHDSWSKAHNIFRLIGSETLHRVLRVLAGMPVAIIHADITPWNVICGDRGVPVAIIDFDDIRVDAPIMDYALLVRGLCFDGRNRLRNGDARFVYTHVQRVEPISWRDFLGIVLYACASMAIRLSHHSHPLARQAAVAELARARQVQSIVRDLDASA